MRTLTEGAATPKRTDRGETDRKPRGGRCIACSTIGNRDETGAKSTPRRLSKLPPSVNASTRK